MRGAVAAVLVLIAPQARAEEVAAPRFVPTAALALGGLSERMALDLAGRQAIETRSDLRLAATLGLAHPALELGPHRRLDGHASISVGPTFTGGRAQLLLREDVTYAHDVWSGMTLRAGLGAGVALDLTRSSMSQGEVGVPLSITFARVVELVYRPYLALALGREERPVFAGSRTRSADTTLVALDLTLRFRLPTLGF